MSGDDIDPSTTFLADWMDRLAEGDGSPGGGAACGVMTAITAAHHGMVAAYTTGVPEAKRARERLAEIRRAAMKAAEDDGVHSADFGAALALPQGPGRDAAVRSATVAAIVSSLAVGRLAASLVAEALLLAEIGNRHVEADLLVAVAALRAALDGVVVTARADLDLLRAHRSADDGLDDDVTSFELGVTDLVEQATRLVAITPRRRG
jgi:formiminotetrahydrofolate cyclodeaminase